MRLAGSSETSVIFLPDNMAPSSRLCHSHDHCRGNIKYVILTAFSKIRGKLHSFQGLKTRVYFHVLSISSIHSLSVPFTMSIEPSVPPHRMKIIQQRILNIALTCCVLVHKRVCKYNFMHVTNSDSAGLHEDRLSK